MRVLLRVTPLLFAAAAVQADWPQFAGPDRTATVQPGHLARRWPPTGPKVLWRVNLGPGFGGPAVRDGQVFLLDRIGNEQDQLRCFDLLSGKELWHYTYAAPGRLPGYNGSRAVPTVDEKYVYSVGPFGHVLCLDRRTHRPVWRMHLMDDFGGPAPRWGVSQSPLRYRDWVILAPCGKDVGLIALQRDTGKIVWKTQPIGDLHHASPMRFNLAGREQILFITDEGLFGFDAETGKTLWQFTGYHAKRYIPSPIAVGDDRVFITAGYNGGSRLLEVKRQGEQFSVRELWRVDLIGAHCQQPLQVGRYLYLLCNTNERRDGLVCLGLDGRIHWQTKRDPGFSKGGLIVADGLIYIVEGSRGTLHLVQPDPAGFRQICQSPPLLDGPKIWAPLALSDGRLLVRDQKQMKCLDVSDGQ